ncbi:RNA exonuclease 3 [Orbilia oligospora]|nr:RNA exonuclease 3 [Orbilia oligospora]KAF3245176.1 RNA exonuclease 3 [Orbilia oligospora]KAF3255561.1 RNA exonuclease 3 [Orbilia oligospora]
MFRPSGLFKSVPCPKVSTCGLQNCLFSHQAVVIERPAPPLTTASTSSISSSTKAKSVSRNERSPTPPPPPKRRRIDEAQHTKSTEAPSNPIIKSILKKSTPSPASSLPSSSPPPYPSSSPSQQPPSSLDSEAGKYVKLKTTDKKTGSITKTRIERAGPSFSSSSSSSSTLKPSGPSSSTTNQSIRSLHTSPPNHTTTTVLSDTDATKLLLEFGKPKPGPPREPERLMPRTVPRAPANFETRHNILVQLHKEFIRLDPDSQKTVIGKQRMIKLANDEEAASALNDIFTYKNIMRNRIFALGKMTPETFKKDLEEKEQSKRKKELPDGNEELVTGLTPEAEVTALGGYVASLLSLKASEYVVLPPSEEEIRKTKEGLEAAGGREECDRCKTRFQVLKEQDKETKSWVTGGSCTHHYGRFVVDGGRKTWGCCATPPGETPGCVEHTNHVFMVKSPVRLASVWQFVETPSAPILSPSSEITPPSSDKKIEKAICMDCEMAFTTKGFEVIRLTATRFPTYEPIVDILVQPYGEVLDLNTRFSGVTQEQFDTALPYYNSSLPNKDDPKVLLRASSPLEAREILFTYIDSSTIIIGHSLDNDLKCMRIIHPRVVDTALLYRHRTPGLRFSLKYLVKTHLGRFIQTNENAQGHDSREDANEAGNLVRKRIQNDVRVGKIGKDGIWAGDVMYAFKNTGENNNSSSNNNQDKVVAAK